VGWVREREVDTTRVVILTLRRVSQGSFASVCRHTIHGALQSSNQTVRTRKSDPDNLFNSASTRQDSGIQCWSQSS